MLNSVIAAILFAVVMFIDRLPLYVYENEAVVFDVEEDTKKIAQKTRWIG